MANAFYGLGLQAFGSGGINWGSDTIKAELVSTAYTPNLATDQYHSTVTGSGGIVAAGVALSTKTNVLGVLGAANTVFSSVTGSQAAYILIWKDTGTDATSPLIALFDTATGLPVTPNGGDITVAWASSKICTLRSRVKRPGLLDWIRGVADLWLPAPTIAKA